jgi:hypothetical protein
MLGIESQEQLCRAQHSFVYARITCEHLQQQQQQQQTTPAITTTRNSRKVEEMVPFISSYAPILSKQSAS